MRNTSLTSATPTIFPFYLRILQKAEGSEEANTAAHSTLIEILYKLNPLS